MSQHHERDPDQEFPREDLYLTLGSLANEVERAEERYRPYASAHEALGVITEEFEEFKLEVFKREGERDYAAMRKELVQLACTAIRAIRDVCDPRMPKPPAYEPDDIPF